TGADLGTADLQVVNGLAQATVTTSDLAIGTHTIQANYAGTTTFSSTTGLLTQTVQPSVLPTATTLSSSANPSVYGQTGTFTAVVSGSSGTPTGTVTFYEGSTTLGTAMLAVVDGVDQGSFSTSALSVATHVITANYSGADKFTSSTSDALSQTVNPA